MTSAAFVPAPQRATPPLAVLAMGISDRSFTGPAKDGENSTALLSRLLSDAFDAFDRDQDVARASLFRAVALLDAQQVRPAARLKALDLGVLAPWQAKKAVAYIEAHLDTPIPIEELAALARLSRSYFSRAFKATFGCAPQTFIQDRRISQAQTLMLTTDEPLCSVALACGFSDQAHLSRIFRRLAGDSPHAWRRARLAAPHLDA